MPCPNQLLMPTIEITLTCLYHFSLAIFVQVKYFEYMMSYSPMQNVKEGGKYPSCLLTCGLNDSRVAYWEATKFAATLRHKQSPESGPVCVKIEMSAGHFSASDRYKYLRELAFDYAFLLDQLGLADK
jgi:oligopeptidase B